MSKQLDIISGTLIAVTAAAFFLHGAEKQYVPDAVVVWDDMFRGVSSTIDTNDFRHIVFAWSAPPAYVPFDARAIISAVHLRDVDTPEPFAVANVSMFAFGAEAWMDTDATNYAYYLECDWVPAAPVVTNGAYHVRAVGTGWRIVPLGARIKIENRLTGETREITQP